MEMEQPKNQGGGELSNYKVKLMVSYGGRIQARPYDKQFTQLTYAGGDTKILTVDRNVKYLDIVTKVNSLCNLNAQFRLKYQLPGGGLEALISLIDDDDVENMMFEYDHIHRISTKPARLRLFLFPPNQCATPGALLNPDFLFGFDKEYDPNAAPDSEFPQSPDVGNLGSDPGDGADKRVRTEIQGMTVTQIRDSNVTSGSSYAYTATAPLVYWVPVTAGAYQGGAGVMHRAGGDREQPVYNFIPVMPSAQEQKMPSGVHVATNHTESFAAGCFPAVTFSSTITHESKA